MTESPEDEDVPTLRDLVRPGRQGARRGEPAADPAASRQGVPPTLSEAEIEAIAARVVERHAATLEVAIARAIRKAVELRAAAGRPAD